MYTEHVGTKFNANGSVREFAGNTVIGMVPGRTQGFTFLKKIQSLYGAYSAFSLLPPDSFHMTIIEGVCDQIRDSAYWSKKISKDSSLAEVNTFFYNTVKKLRFPDFIKMKYKSFRFKGVLLIYLEPENDSIKNDLKSFRDNFASATGLKFSNHETYTFHISLGYQIKDFTNPEMDAIQKTADESHQMLVEAGCVFEISKPSFCTFSDMHAFIPYSGS
jgi:hypothetical protein